MHSRDTSDWVEGRSKATKPKLQAWLDKKNIPYDPKSSRKELYQKCKDFKPPPLYAADEMFKAASIIPLRTIPYTPEHQPIEYVWSEEKHYVYDRHVLARSPPMLACGLRAVLVGMMASMRLSRR